MYNVPEYMMCVFVCLLGMVSGTLTIDWMVRNPQHSKSYMRMGMFSIELKVGRNAWRDIIKAAIFPNGKCELT